MANENSELSKIEPLVRKEWEDRIAQRDARIKELEAEAKALNEKLSAQKKRIDKSDLSLKETAAKAIAMPSGNFVHLDGQNYPIVYLARADNTFAEVKRGHVYEGACMAVIDKVH